MEKSFSEIFLQKEDKIGFILGSIVGLLWFLSFREFTGALAGLLLLTFVGFLGSNLVNSLRNKDWKVAGIYLVPLVITSVTGLVAIVLIFQGYGSIAGPVTAKNPITGECAFSVNAGEPGFPWYYNENKCDISEVCTGTQTEDFCSEVESFRAVTCQRRIHGANRSMSLEDKRDIPDVCFLGNESLSSKLSDAEPGDRMAKTESGLEVIR